MALPVKPLPTIQHWDCHSCGDCCRTYTVRVTADEEARIAGQNWNDDPDLKGTATVVFNAKLGDRALNQKADGTCVFLGADNRCRIHAKFGAEAKPFACRLYPFILVPQGKHWAVSLRYACPSVVDNRGRPCGTHAADVASIAKLVEADQPKSATVPPPPLAPGRLVDWNDLARFTKAILGLLNDPVLPLMQRLRRILMLSALCREATFEKVSGAKLDEFLSIMIAATEDDGEPADAEPPGWIGRVLFRQMLSMHLRQDFGPHAGLGKTSAWARLAAGYRFAVGTGTVPRLHQFLPEAATFDDGEVPLPQRLPAEAESLLVRYLRVKLESCQFAGPTNHDRTYWAGLDSLLLVVPMAMWTTRLLAKHGTPVHAAMAKSLRMIDENFGYSRFLAGGRVRWMLSILAERGELAKLVAWYGRAGKVFAQS